MASFWIQIVGTKDTGKTTLLENLTRELVSRGRTVAYVKHAHAAPTIDSEDTDTARLGAAGASGGHPPHSPSCGSSSTRKVPTARSRRRG